MTPHTETEIDSRKIPGGKVVWHYFPNTDHPLDHSHAITVECSMEEIFFILYTNDGKEAREMFWHPFVYEKQEAA